MPKVILQCADGSVSISPEMSAEDAEKQAKAFSQLGEVLSITLQITSLHMQDMKRVCAIYFSGNRNAPHIDFGVENTVIRWHRDGTLQVLMLVPMPPKFIPIKTGVF